MILKGMNIGGWLSQADQNKIHCNTFITEEDIKKISSWGANSVRVPFDYTAVIDNNLEKIKFKKSGLDYILKIVDWTEKYNLACILDFHITPWHNFLDPINNKKIYFFKDEKAINMHIQMLDHILSYTYKYEHVYLELLNEPQSEDIEDLIGFYKKVINFLRSKNYKNKLIVESNHGAKTETFFQLEELIEYDDLIYSFHFYKPEKFTHQMAYWTPEGSKIQMDFPYYNDEIIYDENYILNEIKPIINFKKNTNREIFCGEFGVYLKAPHQSRLNWIESLLKILTDNGIGYLFWNYKNLDFGLINDQLEFKRMKEYNNEDKTDFELLNLLKKYF